MSKNVQLEFVVPDRQPEEGDITPKQRAFINQLFRKIEIPEGEIPIDGLGVYQASALIDQLIEIRDAGGKAVPISAPGTERPSVLLMIGILFIPYIFAWFTLHPKYSKRTRIISLLWSAPFIYVFYKAATLT